MAAVDVAAPPPQMDWASTAAAEKDVSDGLLKFLQPVVKKCDERLVALLQSQAALAKQVDAFSAEIERIQEQKEGLHLGAYTAKLVASRKKLKRVEMMVMQTKDRIENINRMHNQLLTNEASFRERIEAQAKAAAGQTEVKEEKKEEAEEKQEEAAAEAAKSEADGEKKE